MVVVKGQNTHAKNWVVSMKLDIINSPIISLLSSGDCSRDREP